MDNNSRFDRRDSSVGDSPMYSRLFIVCSKGLKENDFRDAFSKFGEIEEIRLLGDKGVAFIKFSKTTEAAHALEAMHFKTLPGTQRPLKVMVAANRSDVASDDVEKYRRLFVTVPKVVTEDEIDSEFRQYGHITSIILQRDHSTGESKGFAYVSYAKFSQAAHAFEECDKKYRAIFAKPKTQKRPETMFESRIDNLTRAPGSLKSQQYLVSLLDTPTSYDGFTRVMFMCCPQFSQRHMERLFDLVPGMIQCKYFVDLVRNVGKGTVSYSNPRSAAYAVEKLNKFEYPPGMMIFVRPDMGFSGNDDDFGPNDFNQIPGAVSKLRNAIENSSSSNAPDLSQLAEAIAEASKLIKKATGTVTDSNVPDSNDLSYCSAKLPSPQPLADVDSPVAKRCFLVCKPAPPPLSVLRDVFCRFGNLINVYTLPNKTVGYARYASAQAADKAIEVLHGAEICGVRMKVLEADAEAPPRKRERFDDDRY
ncbi:RNA-binding protein 45 [Operophtera brumata]|uniref:RNA-binding protein 45 n=1 Tax=Operophtera brumata TaxID=104452 RepID=A0A0L7L5W8_OPEBR|nr:RNA-binding protein 45 [Operophtera brumata]